jgi:hypothetical protein
MDTPNTDSMRWHPAAGHRRISPPMPQAPSEVVDLATERAIRLLAEAGLITRAAATRRRRTVR